MILRVRRNFFWNYYVPQHPQAPRWSHRMNHDVEDSINPYTIPFVNRYVTCPRLDRRYPNTSFNLLRASHFTRTVMHAVINHLITLNSLWWCITEWAQRYLSVIRSDKSQSRFVPTQQTLLEIPVMYLYSHPVTLWRLAHPRHSYGIREFHNLMV